MESERDETDLILRPGLQIRPVLTHEDVTEMMQRLYGMQDIEIKELNAYDDRNYHILVKENKDFLWPHGYVFKVMNALDSHRLYHIEAQTQMLIYLDSHGFTCPQPVKNLNGKYYSLEELPRKGATRDGDPPSSKHMVRLLTFRPGQLLVNVPITSQLMYQLGEIIARLDRCLQGIQQPELENHKSLWNLSSAFKSKQFTFAVEEEQHRLVVEQVLDDFQRNVMPHHASLEKGIIHGDLNEQNILCSENADGWRISALLDFGDCHINCYLFELAICLCYVMLLKCPPQLDPVDVAGHLLAGYCTVRPLPEHELHMIKTCMCARLCQSLVLGAYSFLQYPDNDYVLSTAKKGWGLLHDLWKMSQSELESRWKNIIASYNLYGDTT